MKVVALKAGFFDGSLRAEGDQFEVPDDAKATWWAAVDGAPKPAKAKAAKETPKALSELAAPGKSLTDALA